MKRKPVNRKRRRRCGQCRELDKTARLREDPITKEVFNRSVLRIFCNKCYQEAVWAV